MNGETNPSLNMYLAAALAQAKTHQVPKSNVELAIKKGTGAATSSEEAPTTIFYECLAPGNIGCIIETLTNNRNRTIADIRHAVNKNGGNMTSVQYLFQRKGRLVVAAKDLDQLEEDAVMSGFAEDVRDVDAEAGTLEAVCEVPDLLSLKKDLEGKGYDIKELEIAWVPNDKVELSETDQPRFGHFLDLLDDLDDVIKVHHNAK
ncbi:hypothetical protein HK097_001062 [Rhizophlyctis rosea]|uniref:YebC-like protein n=1 Tax=Rhizophlyctis rosea TaxID=64517 RepID=A0AAD5WYI9_9FUNG|nr:hypothetical protein HK097_001062 [Rhizophlyctis rosea]